jgi:hypothetical protein
MGFAWGATSVPTLEVARVLLVLQHSCQHEPRLKLARVLHGVQHACQCASWHGFCMCESLGWTL